MSRETDIKAILLADSAIYAITGDRIYPWELTADQGLSSETTPEIWDASGDILPSVLIKMREDVSDGQVENRDDGYLSSVQIAEIYGYEENGYANIDIIMARCKIILPTKILGNSFELEWILTTGRLRDEAALAGASLVRQDWAIVGFS